MYVAYVCIDVLYVYMYVVHACMYGMVVMYVRHVVRLSCVCMLCMCIMLSNIRFDACALCLCMYDMLCIIVMLCMYVCSIMYVCYVVSKGYVCMCVG